MSDNAADIETSAVDCGGRPAVVEVMGEGSDIVLIGLAVPLAWTRPAAEALAGMGHRVTHFDYGPPDGWEGEPEQRTALGQVQDVIDVMDAVGIGAAHVVGLSRGAIAAYGLAARHPDRVNDLVLALPVSGDADVLQAETSMPEPIEGESQLDFLDRMLETVFSDPFLIERLEDARDLLSSPPGTVTRVERADEDPFTADDIVTHPTFIIEGMEDRVVASEHPTRYAETIAGASHLRVDGAYHGWPMEQPDRFARLVAGFVS